MSCPLLWTPPCQLESNWTWYLSQHNTQLHQLVFNSLALNSIVSELCSEKADFSLTQHSPLAYKSNMSVCYAIKHVTEGHSEMRNLLLAPSHSRPRQALDFGGC